MKPFWSAHCSPGPSVVGLWWRWLPVCVGVWLGWSGLAQAQETGSSGSTDPASACDWIVDARGGAGSEFTRIQDAVMDPRVQSGDTICVRPGAYRELVTTAGAVVGSAKVLTFRAAETEKPVMTWPTPTVVPPDGKLTHFVLAFGGAVLNFKFEGPGSHADYVANGLSIMGPTKIENCEISGYDNGFLGFCAANAVDQPSRFTRCTVTGNGTGILSGDTEHVYEYNWVGGNGVGFDCATGSEARILNNVIWSNTSHGIRLVGYMSAWAGAADIANNTIAYNGGHGIYMEWTPAAGAPAKGMPICPVIHNNILAFNTGYAIEANTLYGPMTCTLGGSGGADTCGLSPGVGGCYPQIRHNVIFGNQNGLLPRDEVLNQFWWDWVLVTPPESPYRVYHVPDPVSYGGRQPQNRYEDPKLAADWYLASGSPCIDHGDVDLRPGATQKADPTGVSPKAMSDTGRIDIGFHHPADVVEGLRLGLSVVPAAGGKRELHLTVEGATAGEELTLMQTDALGSPGGQAQPFGSLTASGAHNMFTLGEFLTDDNPLGPRRRFFWLK